MNLNFAQESFTDGLQIFYALPFFIFLALIVLTVVAHWSIFTKAGESGWKSIVPILNIYTLVKIVGREWWWTILYFVPIVQIVAHIIISIDLAKAFGKSTAFGIIAVFIFNTVGYLILGLGDAKYVTKQNES